CLARFGPIHRDRCGHLRKEAILRQFSAWRTCSAGLSRQIATEAFYEQDELASYPYETCFGADMHYPSLFSPLKIGPYQLKHRVVMAPLTRLRAEKPSLAPRQLNVEYYGQRATPGGLIIAEASPVMATGFGNPGVPGI